MKLLADGGSTKVVWVLTDNDKEIGRCITAGLNPSLLEEISGISSNRALVIGESYKKIKEMEDNKEIFVIRPSKRVKIHRVEHRVNKLDEMYQLGIDDTERLLYDLKKYLNI